MQNDVQIDEIQTLERLVRSARAKLIEILRCSVHLRREEHDRPSRELVRDDDLGVGSLLVLAGVLLGSGDVDEGRGKTLEDVRVVGVLVGGDLNGGSGDVLGRGSRELNGIDCNEEGGLSLDSEKRDM
jgi:hypothetical protein